MRALDLCRRYEKVRLKFQTNIFKTPHKQFQFHEFSALVNRCFLCDNFVAKKMMRVATDAQQQRLHLPIRMMSGRQWTEQKKFTIKNK